MALGLKRLDASDLDEHNCIENKNIKILFSKIINSNNNQIAMCAVVKAFAVIWSPND